MLLLLFLLLMILLQRCCGAQGSTNFVARRRKLTLRFGQLRHGFVFFPQQSVSLLLYPDHKAVGLPQPSFRSSEVCFEQSDSCR